MKSDVNKFVDEVYAPYQIKKTIEQDKEAFDGGDEFTLFWTMHNVAKPDSTPDAAEDLLLFLGIYVEELKNEIEDYRSKQQQESHTVGEARE